MHGDARGKEKLKGNNVWRKMDGGPIIRDERSNVSNEVNYN